MGCKIHRENTIFSTVMGGLCVSKWAFFCSNQSVFFMNCKVTWKTAYGKGNKGVGGRELLAWLISRDTLANAVGS
jgi:hypothetical protein